MAVSGQDSGRRTLPGVPGGVVTTAGTSLREIAPEVFWIRLPGRTQTNVYAVRSGSSWVLIDAGWPGDAARIERAASYLFGEARPAAIVLTHCHPDHAGAARQLARGWGCLVYLHPAELPVATGDYSAIRAGAGPLDRWIVLPLLTILGRRYRERTLSRTSLDGLVRPLDPGAPVPELPGWACIATPGHTPGHVSFLRPADRVLVSGDALVTLRVNSLWGMVRQRQGLSGPPWYTTWHREAARASVAALAGLRPAVLAGGHGTPMAGPGTAAALRRFADDAEGAAIEVAVTIARPAADVFDFLADVQDHEPLPERAGVRMVKEPSGLTRVGSRWHERVRLGPGVWLRIETVAVEVQPPLRLGLDFATTWFTGHLSYEVQPTAHGVVLHQRETLRMRWPLRWLTPLVASRLRGHLEERLGDIRTVLESGA